MIRCKILVYWHDKKLIIIFRGKSCDLSPIVEAIAELKKKAGEELANLNQENGGVQNFKF
jgi:hypothetical protein